MTMKYFMDVECWSSTFSRSTHRMEAWELTMRVVGSSWIGSDTSQLYIYMMYTCIYIYVYMIYSYVFRYTYYRYVNI